MSVVIVMNAAIVVLYDHYHLIFAMRRRLAKSGEVDEATALQEPAAAPG